jgi:uncharacterized membrane protein YhaH (DUF805 family)
MNFSKAIKSFWLNYVNFQGRASRSEYWYAILFYLIVAYVANQVGSIMFEPITISEERETNPVSLAWSLAALLPFLSVNIRRLHDANRSGWWILFGLIPIVLFILQIKKSDPNSNRYGDPVGFSEKTDEV